MGAAKAGSMRLILHEFSILMRHEKCDFKNWTLPKILVASLLK